MAVGVILGSISPGIAQAQLPFDPPDPDPRIARLGNLEGLFVACSVRYREGVATGGQRFRVAIQRKVFDLVVAIEFVDLEGNPRRGAQATLLAFDPKAGALRDVTVSAMGSVEYWDETEPWDGQQIALQLRGKARFVIGDDPDTPVDFRKAFVRIDETGYELVYHLSADGVTWTKVFHETAVPARSGSELACEPERG